MYKTNSTNYGLSSVIIEIRSREQFAQHFKVIGHWKKDAADKESVIRTSRSHADLICRMMNAGHTDLSSVLKELEKQNTDLKERVEIIADVNWRTTFGWKLLAFIAGTATGIVTAAFINHLIH